MMCACHRIRTAERGVSASDSRASQGEERGTRPGAGARWAPDRAAVAVVQRTGAQASLSWSPHSPGTVGRNGSRGGERGGCRI